MTVSRLISWVAKAGLTVIPPLPPSNFFFINLDLFSKHTLAGRRLGEPTEGESPLPVGNYDNIQKRLQEKRREEFALQVKSHKCLPPE